VTDTQDKSARPTIDFDHHSAEFADNWREVTSELRTKCPVAWTEAHGGYWVVSRYDDVKAVALDDETFSSDNDMMNERGGAQGTAIPRAPMQLIPLEVDPPRFGKYRTLLNPKFSPKAAEPWGPSSSRPPMHSSTASARPARATSSTTWRVRYPRC
jgi:cytochrome P450